VLSECIAPLFKALKEAGKLAVDVFVNDPFTTYMG
jgi:hypothetical protein